jgi:methylated-DNA-[protein]-cysteine S-methyltransferase
MRAKSSEIFHIDRLDTPIGIALLVTDAEGYLRALDWADYEPRMRTLLRRQYGAAALIDAPAPDAIKNSLSGYFAGDVARLRTIQCRFGGTSFQRSVWTALQGVPSGTTMSYGAFAAALGAPKAVRAVGFANGSNPISVVVPCHRLIGADGSLTGYGGGLERKRWLLMHEGVRLR